MAVVYSKRNYSKPVEQVICIRYNVPVNWPCSECEECENLEVFIRGQRKLGIQQARIGKNNE